MDNMVWAVIMAVAFFVAYRAFNAFKFSRGAVVVKEKIQNGAAIIDVRSPGEFASGHYPGARNIPVDQLSSRLKELGKKENSIIVYCASGGRSSMAKRILDSAGFSDVTNGGGLGNMPA